MHTVWEEVRELSTGLGDVHSSRSKDGVAFWRERGGSHHTAVSVRPSDEWHPRVLGGPTSAFITNQPEEQISCHNALFVSLKNQRKMHRDMFCYGNAKWP